MENVLPKYVRPISKIDDPINYPSFWEDAVDSFDEKKYNHTIINVLSYMNPDIYDGIDTSKDEYEIVKMQGSAELHVKVTKEHISIKAPFLRITNQTNKVALLRKVAEVNFTPLRLAKIVLRNENELWFEYDMPKALAQPNKLYNVIRNIAIYADDYDDMFINDYNAEFYKKPNYKDLSAEEQDQVWAQVTDIFTKFEAYLNFFKEKRWDDWVWDITIIALLKISNMPYVNGEMRTDLIKEIGKLQDSDIDYKLRMDRGTKFMKNLVKISREDFMKHVYHADQFISLRWRSSEQIISDRLKNYLERVQDYEKNESNFNMSYYLQFIFLRLIYNYNLEDNYKQAIYTVLEEVSGLDPNEAAPKLTKVFYAMQTGSINKKEETPKKKGFFSNLFK